MTFVSYSYYLFLALMLILYYILPKRFRWAILLAGSLIFCAKINIYSLAWIASIIIISYLSAIGIEHYNRKEKKFAAKSLFIFSLIVIFGSLFGMKYYKGILSLLETCVHAYGNEWIAPIISVAMPIGFSFYTFQIAGYLIDVYQQETTAIRHVGHYAISIAFFAKLTQGPIAPIRQLAPQFAQKAKINPLDLRKGAVRILIGLVRKVVIADRFAVVADAVFSKYSEMSALNVIIGIVFYAFQLYYDFAGYTDIAIGSAQLFGLRLPENFKQPYLAHSIAEFWRRWHLTLSNWLKSYIYIPLGGNRVKLFRWAMNVMIVFLISGMWHGSGITFVIWGLLHGLYQIIGKITSKLRQTLKTKIFGGRQLLADLVSVLLTFMLVCGAWVFFRAPSISEAVGIFSRLLCGDWRFSLTQLGLQANEWWLSVILVLLLIANDICSEHFSILDWIEKQILPIRWSIYFLLLFLLILFGMYGSLSAQSFIYVSF